MHQNENHTYKNKKPASTTPTALQEIQNSQQPLSGYLGELAMKFATGKILHLICALSVTLLTASAGAFGCSQDAQASHGGDHSSAPTSHGAGQSSHSSPGAASHGSGHSSPSTGHSSPSTGHSSPSTGHSRPEHRPFQSQYRTFQP